MGHDDICKDDDVLEVLESVVFVQEAPVCVSAGSFDTVVGSSIWIFIPNTVEGMQQAFMSGILIYLFTVLPYSKITYKWVCKKFGVSPNCAKRLLGIFADRYCDQSVLVYYQIYGINCDGRRIESKFVERARLEGECLKCSHYSATVYGIVRVSGGSKPSPYELEKLYPDVQGYCQDRTHIVLSSAEKRLLPEYDSSIKDDNVRATDEHLAGMPVQPSSPDVLMFEESTLKRSLLSELPGTGTLGLWLAGNKKIDEDSISEPPSKISRLLNQQPPRNGQIKQESGSEIPLQIPIASTPNPSDKSPSSKKNKLTSFFKPVCPKERPVHSFFNK